MKKVNKFHLS